MNNYEWETDAHGAKILFYVLMIVFSICFLTGTILAEPKEYEVEYYEVMIPTGSTAWNELYDYWLLDEAGQPYQEYIFFVGQANEGKKLGEIRGGEKITVPVRKDH